MWQRSGLLGLILANHLSSAGMYNEESMFRMKWNKSDVMRIWSNLTLDNSTTKDPKYSLTDSNYWIIMSILILTLAVIITLSNAVMIACYIARPKVRSILKVFVFNLCIVDIQNGCIALPLTVVYPRGAATEWMADVTGAECIFISFWPTSLAMTAYLSIVLVTVERFIAVVFPMNYHKLASTRNCVIVVVLIWIYSILFSFAPAYAIKTDTEETEGNFIVGCHGLYIYSEVYWDYFLYAVLILPLVSVLLMYLTMYCVARKHLKAIRKVTVIDPCQIQKDKRVLHNSKATKTTFVMTFIFVICWVPFLIVMLLIDLCNFDSCPGSMSRETLIAARIATACLAFLNSAINPWIYGFRNPLIRKELRMMFCMVKRTAVVSIVGEFESSTGYGGYYSTRYKPSD